MGKVNISGKIKDSDLGNKLEFCIKSDQTFFPDLPREIEKYLMANFYIR
jgi:hypothetical protein